MKKPSLENNHTDILGSLNNIGVLLDKNGTIEQRLHYLKISDGIHLEIIGENHPHISKIFNNVGCYNSMGEYKKSLDFYEKSFEVTNFRIRKKLCRTNAIFVIRTSLGLIGFTLP